MTWDTAYVNKLLNSAFAWIHPDYKSGKSKDKGLRKLPYIDLEGKIDLVHVRAALSYLPKTDGPSETEKATIQKKLQKILEDARRAEGVVEYSALFSELLVEAKADSANHRLADATVIRSGWSSNKLYYGDKALKEAVESGVFADGKIGFVDHPEGRRKYGRSLRDLGAVYSNVRFKEGRVAADIEFVGPDAGWLYDLAEKHPELIGLSIWASGKTNIGKAEGRKGKVVESIKHLDSIDLVAAPAAGGRVEKLREGIVANVLLTEATLEELREHRADLVETVETAYAAAHPPTVEAGDEKLTEILEAKVEAEGQLKATRSQLKLVEGERDKFKKRSEELDKTILLAEAKATLDKALEEAKLPEASTEKLRESLKEEVDKERIAEAVKAESAYVKKLLGAGVVKGAGTASTGRTDEGLTEAQKDMDDLLGIEEKKPKDQGGEG